MSRKTETEIASLLKQANKSNDLAEQRNLIKQATELQQKQAREAEASRNTWDATSTANQELTPVFAPHELARTASATDWLSEVDLSFDPKQAAREMIAEASLWYDRTRDDVKSYGDEYAEQARGVARKLSGKYGDESERAERAFLDEASRLRTIAVRSGRVVEANDGANMSAAEPESSAAPEEGVQPTESGLTMSSSLNHGGPALDGFYAALDKEAASGLPEVTDNNGVQGYTNQPMFPAQNGVLPPEATSSNRAPALQELDGTPSEDVVPANDPGLQNETPFPVSGTQKESKHMTNQLPSIGDISKFAASGLDQIDQIADAKDNPSAPGIPFPQDVAFPWTLNPAQQVPAAINQAEQQINERNQKSPLASTAGRDNSGWIGDMGGRGTDYPGDQAPTGDQSTSVGYQDPVYGQGGDQGNEAVLPYGHQEANDRTNNPSQWQYGQPTQDDNGWREAVRKDANLQGAYQYIQARYNAHVARRGR